MLQEVKTFSEALYKTRNAVIAPNINIANTDDDDFLPILESEVLEVLRHICMNASPGTDGITSRCTSRWYGYNRLSADSSLQRVYPPDVRPDRHELMRKRS